MKSFLTKIVKKSSGAPPTSCGLGLLAAAPHNGYPGINSKAVLLVSASKNFFVSIRSDEFIFT